jgi:hypothetical protein
MLMPPRAQTGVHRVAPCVTDLTSASAMARTRRAPPEKSMSL